MPMELVTSSRGPTFRPHTFPVEDTRLDLDPYVRFVPAQRRCRRATATGGDEIDSAR
jgi:hypothetical protein